MSDERKPWQPGDRVTMTPVKFGQMIPISHELGLAYGIFRRTPEEEARWQEQLKAADAKRARDREATAEWLQKLATITDPLSLAILELHSRLADVGSPVCDGCDFDGYEAEEPGWPCRTVRLVAEFHGMPAPERVEF